VGTQYADQANDAKLPAFTLVDAALTYDLERLSPNMKGVRFQLNALNLFDTYYVNACTGSPNFCQLGESRTLLATLKYTW
jgi:iron complex outermembrane receptor protein